MADQPDDQEWLVPDQVFSDILDDEEDVHNLFSKPGSPLSARKAHQEPPRGPGSNLQDSQDLSTSFVSEFMENLPATQSWGADSAQSPDLRSLGRSFRSKQPPLSGAAFLDGSSIISDISVHQDSAWNRKNRSALRSRSSNRQQRATAAVQDENDTNGMNTLNHSENRADKSYAEQKSHLAESSSSAGMEFNLSDILPTQSLQRIQASSSSHTAQRPSSRGRKNGTAIRESENLASSTKKHSRKRSRPQSPSNTSTTSSSQEPSAATVSPHTAHTAHTPHTAGQEPSLKISPTPTFASPDHLSQSWGALRTPAFLKGAAQSGPTPQSDFEHRLEMVRNAELEMAESETAAFQERFRAEQLKSSELQAEVTRLQNVETLQQTEIEAQKKLLDSLMAKQDPTVQTEFASMQSVVERQRLRIGELETENGDLRRNLGQQEVNITRLQQDMLSTNRHVAHMNSVLSSPLVSPPRPFQSPPSSSAKVNQPSSDAERSAASNEQEKAIQTSRKESKSPDPDMLASAADLFGAAEEPAADDLGGFQDPRVASVMEAQALTMEQLVQRNHTLGELNRQLHRQVGEMDAKLTFQQQQQDDENPESSDHEESVEQSKSVSRRHLRSSIGRSRDSGPEAEFGEFHDPEAEIDALTKQLDERDVQIETLETKILDLETERDRLEAQMDELGSGQETRFLEVQTNLEKEKQELQEAVEDLQEKLSAASAGRGGASADDSQRPEELQEALRETRAALEQKQQELKEVQTALGEAERRLGVAEDDVTLFQSRLETARQEKLKLNSAVVEQSELLETLEKSRTHTEAELGRRLEEQRGELDRSRATLQEERLLHQDKTQELRRQLLEWEMAGASEGTEEEKSFARYQRTGHRAAAGPGRVFSATPSLSTDSLKQKLRTLQSEQESLRAEAQGLRQELEALRRVQGTDRTEWEQQKATLEAEVRDLSEKRLDLRQESDRFRIRLQEAEEELAGSRKLQANRLSSLDQELRQRDSTAETEISRYQEQEDEIQELRTELREKSEELEELKQQLEDLESENRQTSLNSSRTTDKDYWHAQEADWLKEKEDLEAEVQASEEARQDLESTLEELRSRLSARESHFNTRCSYLEEELDVTKQQLAKDTSEFQKLQTQQETRLQQSRSSAQALQEELSELQATHAQTQAQIAKLKEALAQKEANLEDLRSQERISRSEAAAQRTTLQQLQDSLVQGDGGLDADASVVSQSEQLDEQKRLRRRLEAAEAHSEELRSELELQQRRYVREVEELRSQLRLKSQGEERSRGRLEETLENCAELSGWRAAAETELQNTRGDSRSLKERLVRKTRELEQVRLDQEDLKLSLATYRRKLRRLDDQKQTIQTDRQLLRGEVRKLRRRAELHRADTGQTRILDSMHLSFGDSIHHSLRTGESLEEQTRIRKLQGSLDKTRRLLDATELQNTKLRRRLTLREEDVSAVSSKLARAQGKLRRAAVQVEEQGRRIRQLLSDSEAQVHLDERVTELVSRQLRNRRRHAGLGRPSDDDLMLREEREEEDSILGSFLLSSPNNISLRRTASHTPSRPPREASSGTSGSVQELLSKLRRSEEERAGLEHELGRLRLQLSHLSRSSARLAQDHIRLAEQHGQTPLGSGQKDGLAAWGTSESSAARHDLYHGRSGRGGDDDVDPVSLRDIKNHLQRIETSLHHLNTERGLHPRERQQRSTGGGRGPDIQNLEEEVSHLTNTLQRERRGYQDSLRKLETHIHELQEQSVSSQGYRRGAQERRRLEQEVQELEEHLHLVQSQFDRLKQAHLKQRRVILRMSETVSSYVEDLDARQRRKHQSRLEALLDLVHNVS